MPDVCDNCPDAGNADQRDGDVRLCETRAAERGNVMEGLGTCPDGGCTAACSGSGACDMSCPGNDCNMTCSGTGACQLTACTGDCDLTCSNIGTCSQTCDSLTCTTSHN